MSTSDYASLIDNPRKLLPCQKNKVFLSNVYDPRRDNSPNKKAETFETFVLNTSPVQVSRFRFKADVLSNFALTLYEGTRFVFGNDVYYLAQQLDLLPDIPMLDVSFQTRSEIPPDGASGILKCIYPYFGVSGIQEVNEDESIEGNVFSGGYGMEKALVGISSGYEMTGAKVINDPGYELLYECKTTGKCIDVQIIEHFIGVDEFQALVINMDRVIDQTDFFQIKCLIAKLI